MISTSYEHYRKELNRYKHMVVSAVVKKNFPEDEEIPFYSLDVEIEMTPKTDEEIEKNISSQLFKSYDFDKVIKYYDNIQKVL